MMHKTEKKKNHNFRFHLIVIIAIILFAIGTIPKTFQEDTYYLIKVGEYISQNGMGVIENKIEPFSWHEGLSYTYPHWLFDMILYLVYSLFDVFGIYVFTVLIGVSIYLLIYYTNLRVGKNNILSAIITIVSIYLLSGYITARAQIITYICCILTILLIERFLEKGKKKYLIGLIIVPIILANCHAALFPIYFIIYLPYIAEYLISFFNKEITYYKKIETNSKKITKLKKNSNIKKEKIEKLEIKLLKLQEKLKRVKEKNQIKNRKIIIEKNENVKWLIIVFIITLFTGFLTPLGDLPYTYMLKSIQGNTMNYITEHQPVVLIHSLALLTIFGVIIILLFSNKIKIKLRDVFMLLGMGFLALVSYKQFPIFLICTMCIVHKLLCLVINANTKDKIEQIIYQLLSIKGIIYSLLIIIILFLVQYRNIAGQSYIDNNAYPISAVTWLKGNVDIEKMRLYNNFNYGSYLLFKDIPVFIDGRADVYDPVFNKKEQDIFLDYMKCSSLKVWYEEIFKKYGITHMLIQTNEDLNIFLERNINYKKLYDDGVFTIYEFIEL